MSPRVWDTGKQRSRFVKAGAQAAAWAGAEGCVDERYGLVRHENAGPLFKAY